MRTDGELTNLHGRVMILTGATSGIGLEAARELARRGVTVVGISRDPQKCAAIAEEVRRTSGNPRVEYLPADLSIMAEVQRVAAEFRARYPVLHVLINNAGAIFYKRQYTLDGYEKTWALNVLSPFLLTNELAGLMVRSAPARIINVASNAHRYGKVDFDDLNAGGFWSAWAAYGQSKLALVMFTYEMARRLEGSGVTVNALHPGLVKTDFGHKRGVFNLPFRTIQAVAAIRPERGADTPVYLATAPDVANVTGKYFVRRTAIPSAPQSYNGDNWRRLWSVCERQVGAALARTPHYARQQADGQQAKPVRA